VKGRATKWNDAIAPVCASEADVYTGKISGTVPPDTSIGGTGGLRYERHCPAYMAVRALKGKFKDYVDRIELECQRLSHLESVQTSWLTAWGGNGVPTTFEKCPGRAALVGLTYRSGTSIDQVGGQCSEITTACSGSTCVDSRATSMYQMPSRGGTGGTPGEQTCPSGKALVGLQVRSGTEIDALGAICATTTTWTNPSAACTAANGCIKVFDTTGQGGNRRDPLWCPAGQFLNGWIVGHATRVNSIQPLCRNFNP